MWLSIWSMVAHNCHGETKNLTAKTKTSRQNQKPYGENKIPHGKTKNLTATKTKYLTAKPKTLRQNQMLHSKTKIALVQCRGYLLLPWGIWFLLWSIWFCREVFGFAVRFLVLLWGFCFCREVFGFSVRDFVFAVGFLVLPWQLSELWATVAIASHADAIRASSRNHFAWEATVAIGYIVAHRQRGFC